MWGRSRELGTIRQVRYATTGRVCVEIENECGGLPDGIAETIFDPSVQKHSDRTGLGPVFHPAGSRARSRHSRRRESSRQGCVFKIDLPDATHK
jgi:hypothetical protein